ncbi:hypothetical protein [Flammeovirga kamogawensis]|uniref:Uncharacterized protein n=1 Tax=Flammeovirga kamogawensis TaxID=373891 RepID=A0ABX8GXI1_9BACT|nr:hypothetical protein [Flammeovirga kamogawensis]MBB6460954.1 hypothetical protein [Flammeovirga kamogawensis]QWG08295.1 hypothetical protein KM029_04995 [Flammeovirga kamogawensis]TRX66593.1 hypothetical protein EO216_00065 [Flammeovirga kamogawensis]
MSKKFLLSTLFLTIPFFLFAQEYAFEGLINTELKVRVRFDITDNKAEGYCIYISSKEKLPLTGEQKEDGTVILKQSNGERFEGKIIASYMYKGEYFNAEGVDQGTFLFSKTDVSVKEDDALLTVSDSTAHSSVQTDRLHGTETEVNDILRNHLAEFKRCYTQNIDPLKCRQASAMAICELFQTNDFKDPYVGGSYLTMSESYDHITASSDWKMLGEASSATLKDAQERANEGELVIVSYPFKGFIQLGFIRKGEAKMSSKWNMNVPSIAIFFYNDPEKSSIDKQMNFIWRSPENIEVWVKK